MSFEQALDMSLAAAVGDDLDLVAELRGAFLESAGRHVDAMRRAESTAEWRDAALRLKGLAASFGASTMLEAAGRASEKPAGDAQAMAAVQGCLAILSL